MEVLGETVDEMLGLCGSEVEDCDGVVVGSVVDGKVKTFVVEVGEEFVEEVDGGGVDGSHVVQKFRS